MAMDAAAVAQLAVEGIINIQDLADFDEDSLKQVAENLRRPSGRIPDPNVGAVAGAMIPTPPFVFGAKTQMRLLVATDLVRFYETIGRDLSVTVVVWEHVMKNFNEQWKAIKDGKKATQPEVPTISKSLTIIRWIEAFQDHCFHCFGVRFIPLAYVIRDTVEVPVACPARQANQPYSIVDGSV